ncbi:hypothetical protein HTZ85_26040 [Escherichia coli]|nr:hypothetical protein [Escherichia coli]
MYVPPESPSAEKTGAVRRQASRDSCAIRRSGPTHRSGVQGAPHPARPGKNSTAQQWHVVVTGTPLPHR